MTMAMDNPEWIVRQVQAGDHDLREQLIEMNLPFIKRTIRQVTHSWFIEQQDEFSIALEAFNHAIDRYRTDSEAPFEPYARVLSETAFWTGSEARSRLAGNWS